MMAVKVYTNQCYSDLRSNVSAVKVKSIKQATRYVTLSHIRDNSLYFLTRGQM